MDQGSREGTVCSLHRLQLLRYDIEQFCIFFGNCGGTSCQCFDISIVVFQVFFHVFVLLTQTDSYFAGYVGRPGG
jgi:hypothetical protein